MLDDKTKNEIESLPCFSGKLEIMPLTGGITNRNYRVTDTSRQSFVVRMGRDIPAHGVLRFNELAAARAAQAAGVSPEVIHAGDGFLVSRFIDGRTLTPGDVRAPHNLERIVRLLRRCHHEIPHQLRGPSLIFWVFQVNRSYLGLLKEKNANPFDVALDVLAEKNEELEELVGPVNIVFGHNDLLAANLLDDGLRLWLIDWDYAGFNSPLFDLANLASNNEFSPEHEAALLESYFLSAPTPELLRAFRAMKCASLLREALWSAVSRITSTLDFDYTSYARDYMQRFDRMWLNFEKDNG